MDLSEGPAASSRGLPGPPWVPESSGGAGPGAGLEAEAWGLSVTPWGTEGLPEGIGSAGFGVGVSEAAEGAEPGAGLEAEARGVSVTPWGTEGLLQWTSSVGLGAGVGEEARGAGPKDMFWVVTGEVQGPPSAGTGTWAGGLGDAVLLGWGAAGPAEAEVPEPRVLELSSGGSGLTCCGKGPAEARRFMASAGPKLVPTEREGFPGAPGCCTCSRPAASPRLALHTRRRHGGARRRAGELLNPPGRAWVTSESPPASQPNPLFLSSSQGPPTLQHPGRPAQP